MDTAKWTTPNLSPTTSCPSARRRNRALPRNPASKRGDLVFLFCRRRRFRLSLRTVAPADDLLRVLKRHPVPRRLARHQGTSRRLPNLPAVPNIGDFETARHATSAGFGRWLLSQQNHRADGAPYLKRRATPLPPGSACGFFRNKTTAPMARPTARPAFPLPVCFLAETLVHPMIQSKNPSPESADWAVGSSRSIAV